MEDFNLLINFVVLRFALHASVCNIKYIVPLREVANALSYSEQLNVEVTNEVRTSLPIPSGIVHHSHHKYNARRHELQGSRTIQAKHKRRRSTNAAYDCRSDLHVAHAVPHTRNHVASVMKRNVRSKPMHARASDSSIEKPR